MEVQSTRPHYWIGCENEIHNCERTQNRTMSDMETRLKLLLNPIHSRQILSYIQCKISLAKLHERTFVKAIC